MRAALLSLGYPPYVFGGVETQVSLLSNELAANGIKTTVITGWLGKHVSQENLNTNLRVIRLPIPNYPIRMVWFQLFNRTGIMRILKDADIVHANSPQSSLLSSSIARIKPLVTTLHGSIQAITTYRNASSPTVLSPGDVFYMMEYPLIRNWYLKDLLNSHLLLATAGHVRNEAIEYSGHNSGEVASKSEIVYAGVDLEQLRRVHTEPSIFNGLEMAFIGRLFYPKGITYALQTLDVLVNEMGQKSTKLHIFGSGPLSNWTRRYAKKRRIRDNLVIHGQIKRTDLLIALGRMHVVLLPSLYEGCPYAVVEANSFGVPVVSFDFPWSREFITNDLNGYRSRPFDTHSLAESVLRATRLNPSPIEAQAKKYDVKLTVRKVIEAYRRLLQD
jgi:glycosyltransferase involved in cell wall biosynthesis